MAVGVDTIKTSGRLIFDLERGDEKTTRTLDIAYPITDPERVQEVINTAESVFSGAANEMNTFIQPANWRDGNIAEQQWTTKHVHYEIVTVATTPIEPDEAPTVAGGRSDEAQAEERSQEEQGQPQGEWQG